MICLKCDNEEFVEKPNVVVEQEFRGETLKVKAPMMVCTECGWKTARVGQLDELRKRTADAYRKKHGLLTSDEIRSLRERLGLSQREFADRIKAGVASVKRWETWQVQDASMDLLMRMVANEEHESPTLAGHVKVNLRRRQTKKRLMVYIHGSQISAGLSQVKPNQWRIAQPRLKPQRSSQPENCYDDTAFLSAA